MIYMVSAAASPLMFTEFNLTWLAKRKENEKKGGVPSPCATCQVKAIRV